jgi:hypothetical protein
MTQQLPPDVLSFENETYTIDVNVLAPKLGLTPLRLQSEMRAGRVLSTTEKGIDTDEGRVRLTFRYRSKSWAIQIEPDGRIFELPATRQFRGEEEYSDHIQIARMAWESGAIGIRHDDAEN